MITEQIILDNDLTKVSYFIDYLQNRGIPIELLETSWTNSHVFLNRAIVIGVQDCPRELLKYVLMHEIAHILRPREDNETKVENEINTWKIVFTYLPISKEALEMSQFCINSYVLLSYRITPSFENSL